MRLFGMGPENTQEWKRQPVQKEPAHAVTDVAFTVGYETSQALAKALRELTGRSATELRANPSQMDKIIAALSTPRQQPEIKPLEVKLVTIEPFKVIASRHSGAQKGLFEAYGKLFAWAEIGGIAENLRGIYGVPIDEVGPDADEDCQFDCCFDFGAAAKPDHTHIARELGGGLYAVARHIGHYDGLHDVYDSLYGSWLTSTRYELRDSALFHHYLADPESLPPEEWETDVYLPVIAGA
ncbi:MAG: GyrI-like domain-containing protein [Proteobacteria bacterium]|nr:GyrI-like domain-containing protein [Pseudomonadota bacterium]